MNTQGRLARQWQMLAAISQTRQGLSLGQLMRLSESSRATTYRDLKLLIDAGVPLLQEDGRYRLLSPRELPPVGLTALQIASLHLARLQLGSLEGAPLVVELDRLLARLQRPSQQAFQFAPSRKPKPQPEILKTLERAQRYRKRASIEYRAASRGGAPATVHVEPLVFNVAEGDAYLLAYCVERDRESTYKISRITPPCSESRRSCCACVGFFPEGSLS